MYHLFIPFGFILHQPISEIHRVDKGRMSTGGEKEDVLIKEFCFPHFLSLRLNEYVLIPIFFTRYQHGFAVTRDDPPSFHQDPHA